MSTILVTHPLPNTQYYAVFDDGGVWTQATSPNDPEALAQLFGEVSSPGTYDAVIFQDTDYTLAFGTSAGFNTKFEGSSTAGIFMAFHIFQADTDAPQSYNSYAEVELGDLVTLRYEATGGGSIIGETVQTLQEGALGTPVEASADIGHVFMRWSDNNTSPTRQDGAANVTYTAIFVSDVVGDANKLVYSQYRK